MPIPIIAQQRRLAEKGRIRLGEKRPTGNGKTRPAKLDRFRFTSADQTVIDGLASLYGGTVEPWEGQWQVVSETRVVPVMLIPAAMGFSQWFEDWTGAVCRKRCDGVTDGVRDCACDCDPDNRTCKTTTRLSVILPDLPGLGVWRLETRGYYAAVELAAAVEMVGLAAGAGAMLPARLRLEDRTVRRLVDDKVETFKFVVPVVDLDVTARSLLGLHGGSAPAVGGTGGGASLPPGVSATSPALPAPGETPADGPPPSTAGWKPVAPAPALAVSVRDQLDEVQRTPKPRKNAAAPIKATGRAPLTAAEAVCHLCAEPYGDKALKRNPSSEGNRFVHVACATAMEQATEDGGSSQPPEGAGDTRDTGDGDRSGTSSGGGPAAAEPAPVASSSKAPLYDRVLPTSMHRKLMALSSAAFPVDTKTMSGAEADEYRRANVIALAGQLGFAIESRTDLDRHSAGVVIDALDGLKAGRYRWVEDRLIEAESGAVVEAP